MQASIERHNPIELSAHTENQRSSSKYTPSMEL